MQEDTRLERTRKYRARWQRQFRYDTSLKMLDFKERKEFDNLIEQNDFYQRKTMRQVRHKMGWDIDPNSSTQDYLKVYFAEYYKRNKQKYIERTERRLIDNYEERKERKIQFIKFIQKNNLSFDDILKITGLSKNTLRQYLSFPKKKTSFINVIPEKYQLMINDYIKTLPTK